MRYVAKDDNLDCQNIPIMFEDTLNAESFSGTKGPERTLTGT